MSYRMQQLLGLKQAGVHDTIDSVSSVFSFFPTRLIFQFWKERKPCPLVLDDGPLVCHRQWIRAVVDCRQWSRAVLGPILSLHHLLQTFLVP
jgi:hypothetical protein